MVDFNRSLAVVVGIDNYQNDIQSLRTAVNDARAVSRVLQERHHYGPVRLLLDDDASLEGLRALLQDELPNLITANDRLLFYFAGHGVALDDEERPVGYLVPSDAKRRDESSFLPMHELHDALLKLECRHLLAVFDCCFAGAFRWTSTRNLRVAQTTLYQERYNRFIRDAAWQVITSAAHDQEALDLIGKRFLIGRRDAVHEQDHVNGEHSHSPFAAALLQALNTGEADEPEDGVLTATDLYLYLRDRVELDESNRFTHQTPGLWPLEKHDKGEYVFYFPERATPLPRAIDLNRKNNPYRGLKPYDESHAHLFFGRTTSLEFLHARVVAEPFTTVLGPSGVGKSSLVMAGLLPALKERLDADWAFVTPIRPAQRPLRALDRLALPAPGAQGANLSTGEDDSHLPAHMDGDNNQRGDLYSRIDSWLTRNSPHFLLLIVDQLEELFTLCDREWERAQFMDRLLTIARHFSDRVRIVVTLRSDFEPRFAQLVESLDVPEFGWRQTHFVVAPMTRAELSDVIERPAQEQVFYFSPPTFTAELVDEVAQMPGALPLLSFTLSELYFKYVESDRTDRTLTRADYEALGRVVGSLKSRADEEYLCLDDRDRISMQNLLLRMVSLDGGDLARRRLYRADLAYDDADESQRARRIVERLIDVRLLVSGKDMDGRAYVEPAHDELVRGWPRLSTWIDGAQSSLDNLLFRRRLAQDAALWRDSPVERNDGNRYVRWVLRRLPPPVVRVLPWQTESRDGLLWSDGEQSSALEAVLLQGVGWMNASEAEFARRSVEQNQLDRSVRRMAIAVLIVLTIAAMTTAIWALDRQQVANTNLQSERISTSLRQSIQSTEQLTEDPVAGVHLGLAAVPHEMNVRPYVPESELALTRAVRSSQERGFVTFGRPDSNVPLTDKQVAWSDDWIAVGGNDLNLVDPTLTETLSMTRGTTTTVTATAWNQSGILLSHDGRLLEVWPDVRSPITETFTSDIACAEWRPTGDQIAICSGQNLWRWAYAGGTPVRVRGLDRDVRGARWSPDSRYLAAWDVENILYLADVVSDESIPLPAAEQQSSIVDVAWSPDSRHLGVAMANGTVHLIEPANPDSWTVMQVAEGRQQTHMVFLDETRFLSWAPNAGLALWTIGADESQPLDLGADFVESLSIRTHPYDLLVLSTEGAVQHWDLSQNPPQRLTRVDAHTGKVLAAAWHRDNRYLATTGVDGTARIWDMAARPPDLITVLHGHTSPVFDERQDVLGVHWQDERHVVTYGMDGSLRRWEVFDVRGQPICHGLDVEQLPRCFDENLTFRGHRAAIPVARWVDDDRLITADRGGVAGRLDLSVDEPTLHFLTPEPTSIGLPPTLVWDPAGSRVFTYVRQSSSNGLADSEGLIRDFATGDEIARLPGLIEEAFWLEHGLLVSNLDKEVRLVDPQTGETMRDLTGYTDHLLAAQQFRDQWLATGEADGTIRIWNLQADEPAIVLNQDAPLAEQVAVTGLQWNRDGTRLLSMGRFIMLWDVAARAQQWLPIDTGFMTTYAAFSPDELNVAVAIDTSLAVLDARSGAVLWAEEEEHDQPLRGVVWTTGPVWPYQRAPWLERLAFWPAPQRSLVLSWSGDGTARIWDWRQEREIARMTDIGGIDAAAVNPNGTTIVTTTNIFSNAGPEGIVRIWHAWHRVPHALLATAHDRTIRPLTPVQERSFVLVNDT